MEKMRRSLFHSVIALILCFSMLLGTTYAWFTDSVTSANNIIKAGNLDLEVWWTEDLTSSSWKNAEDANSGAIFDYDKWEPGYTCVRYIKLVNNGDLAFKYLLNVIPNGDMGILADVIDVYYVENAQANVDSVENMTAVGTLADVVGKKVSANGVLLPEGTSESGFYSGEIIVAIALSMQESAGNEYQGKSIGTSFSIELLATQYSYEEDVFGKDYDTDAEWPNKVSVGDNEATAPVTPDANNKLTADTALANASGKISATVPAGTSLAQNTTELTLSVSDMSKSEANITLDENEASLSVDVHIEGIAADNEAVIAVDIAELLPVGLNMGNYRLYHVEGGATVAMTLLADGATPAHNNYEYDPATGDVTLYLKSFSEVALVANNVNAWNGTVAQGFAGGTGEENTPYLIANADQFVYFGELISNDNGNYGDKYYKLIADINFGGEDNANEGKLFYPIGYHKVGEVIAALDADDAPEFVYQEEDPDYAQARVSVAAEDGETAWYTYGGSFKGTFDGNGNTVSNIYQNTWQLKGNYDGNYWNAAMGLFGYVNGGTVKNLTVDNFSSDGEFTPTGVIAAYATNSTFENIAITNCNPRVYNTGNGGIVGIGGNSDDPESYNLTFTNITIDNTNKISALWGSWDVACGGLVGMFRGAGHVNMTNCHVAAQIDVFNDVCGNYQYYWYRYSGMMIGTNKNMTTDANGYTVPETDKFHAENCTVHFGEWNDYYYCELVANSLASYTHDHQFSRLTEISSLDEIKSGNTWTKAGNFLLISGDTKTCYHIVNKNGTLTQHLHTDAGEETVGGETVLKEDKQIVYLPFNQLFTGYGWGVKHIPVYNGENYAFDGITILDREVADSVEKFEGKVTELNNNKEYTLGDIFSLVDSGVALVPSALTVTVTNLDENNPVSATFVRDGKNWENGTIEIKGVGQVTITIQDYYFCTPTTITVNVVERQPEVKFDVVMNNGDFLHRVGNENKVSLDKLFKAKDGATVGTIAATVETVEGDANGTFGNNEIKFSGTGVVEVTIQDDDYCIPTVLYLEVVDAKNTTTASFSGNTVLLNDVSTSSTLSASGVVYGNGFTVNMENAPISEKNGAVFHLYDGAVLKNLGIVGKEFTTVAMNVNDTNYGVSAVRAWGTVVIENCYISGCRSAVSVTGSELTIKDSVIANGVYANIDFRSGILNLHNVTTVNEPHTVNGTTIVGLGIVGNMTASAGRKINITGTLTQYNWLSKTDCENIKANGVSSIFNSVFTDDKYASLRYTYNGTTYVNTGILSLCSDFVGEATTGLPDAYGGMDVTATISNVSVDGYVWAPAQADPLTVEDMKYHDSSYEWMPNDQGTSYIPSSLNFTNAGLTAENGVVQIEYESGSSYTLSPDIVKKLFAPTKYGQNLSYTVAMNGEDYTDEDIVLDATASQSYTITFTVTDNLVYDKDGKKTNTEYKITKTLKVFATVVDKGADAPAFTFYYGTNGSASAGTPHTTQPTNSYTSTIKQVGETYYIMPNVSATTANAIGSQTVDGETIYYPIVDGINVRSGSSTDYDFTRYYPIFKAITVSDNGTEYSYSGTKEIPATVAWVSATIDSGNGASALNDGFGLYDNQYLCKIQAKAGNAESGGTSVVKFSYTALDGNTYYYYVGYRFYDEDEGGVCVTPDTLVTLADGTQVRIDSLTGNEELLVWNHETGKLEKAPIAYIVDHEKAISEHEVIRLTFADGKAVKIIGEHVFFDATLNRYVAVNSENAESFIGHTFVALNESGASIDKITLVSVNREVVETAVYEVVSYKHLTCFTEGILSTSAYLDSLLNVFEIDNGTLMYDAAKIQKDIETYGVYTYSDFEGLISEEAFELYNAKYLKIAVGKGYITWNDILSLIDIYFNVNVKPIQ